MRKIQSLHEPISLSYVAFGRLVQSALLSPDRHRAIKQLILNGNQNFVGDRDFKNTRCMLI